MRVAGWQESKGLRHRGSRGRRPQHPDDRAARDGIGLLCWVIMLECNSLDSIHGSDVWVYSVS